MIVYEDHISRPNQWQLRFLNSLPNEKFRIVVIESISKGKKHGGNFIRINGKTMGNAEYVGDQDFSDLPQYC